MDSQSNKILIVTPPLKFLGGIALHYVGLKNYWTEDIEYYETYKAAKDTNTFVRLFRKLFDLVKFLLVVLITNPKTVVFNLSLKKGLFARYIHLKITKFFGKKIIVFIHGWNDECEYMLYSPKGKWILRNTDGMIVLAKQFKEKLLKYGFKKKIFITTTKVDDAFVRDFNVQTDRDYNKKNILFLARIEKTKGIYETVDTFALLKKQFKDLTLTFVGDGTELDSLKQYVASKSLQEVRFTGRLHGESLSHEYKAANFFFFPSYSEGMPAVVLEAMTFGLPIFTRKVGGLVDFFEIDKMGYISDTLDPEVFAEAMIPYINDSELTRKVSQYNAKYAKEHFLASQVAKQLQLFFKSI